ncbi:MAG: hypothetical protein JO097_08080, partial [Acidobacteriaceae bacterium]|nr:hypothetical protein [Acidobacteriaceae bacterium]
SRIQDIPVEQLTLDEATEALGHRLGKDSAIYHAVTSNPRLADLSCSPLLLEMMCQIERESWKKFAKDQTKGKLYDLWFEEIIVAGSAKDTMLTDESVDETRAKVEAVARIMLQTRRDLVPRTVIEENKVPIERLRTPDTRPFGIFVEEAKDEWGFVHGSFREFTLAKTIEAELKGGKYDLIAKYDQFDYVGAELLLFLRDLFPNVDDLLASYERAIHETSANLAVWDKVLWNAFDTVGNVGTDSAERFIDMALEILRPGGSLTASLSPRTQYNMVRCIERLHGSAPRPYCDYLIKRALSRQAHWEEFGAFAIRGFHVDVPQPGYFPPVYYRCTRNTSKNDRQKKVSDLLLCLVENMGPDPDLGQTYLEINASFALIRWLHEEDIPRARSLLRMKPNGGDLSPMSRGNLFQAFLRFGKPEIFAGFDCLFDGMHLAYTAIEPSMVPADFVFRRVTFFEHRRSKIDGLVLDNTCVLA